MVLMFNMLHHYYFVLHFYKNPPPVIPQDFFVHHYMKTNIINNDINSSRSINFLIRESLLALQLHVYTMHKMSNKINKKHPKQRRTDTDTERNRERERERKTQTDTRQIDRQKKQFDINNIIRTIYLCKIFTRLKKSHIS